MFVLNAPPTDLNSKKFRSEEKKGHGRQTAKKKKDKYNPYEIYEKDGKYYVSFTMVKKEYKDLEIGKRVYMRLLIRLNCRMSHMNVVDRHIEQSRVWDSVCMNGYFRKKKV